MVAYSFGYVNQQGSSERNRTGYTTTPTPIGGHTHKFQEVALRLASQFEAEWIEKPAVGSVIGRVYGFYAGQMPYSRRPCSRVKDLNVAEYWEMHVTDAIERRTRIPLFKAQYALSNRID